MQIYTVGFQFRINLYTCKSNKQTANYAQEVFSMPLDSALQVAARQMAAVTLQCV